MKNIFEGFGPMDDGAEKPIPQQPIQPPKSPAAELDMEQDTTVSPTADPAQEKAQKAKYEKYLSEVRQFNTKINNRRKADKDLKEAEKWAPDAEKDKEKVLAQYKSKKDKISSDGGKLVAERKRTAELLEKQKQSSVSIVEFKRPEVDEEVVSVLKSSVAHRELTNSQSSFLRQAPQEVCGNEKAIKSISSVKALEDSFAHSAAYQQIVQGVPKDEYLSKMAQKIALYVSIAIVVLNFLGGLGLGTGLLSLIVYVVMFVVVGAVATFICLKIAQGIFGPDSFIALIAAVVVGFFVVGSAVASSTSKSISNAVANGSFIVSLIVGVFLGGVNWFAVYLILTLTPALRWLQNIPFLKGPMRKGVFQELENTENLNEAMYCVLNHDAVCNFFEENEVQMNIDILGKMLKDKTKELKKLQQDYSDVCTEEQKASADADAKIAEARRKAAAVAENKRRASASYVECVNAITGWDDRPRLQWLDEYALQPSICFEGVRPDGIVVKACGSDGLAIHYNGTQRIDEAGVLAQKVVSAFQKLNPPEIMNIAVINPSTDMSFFNLDWIYETMDASGGRKRRSKGTIRRVDSMEALKKYISDLRISRENRRRIEDDYSRQLSSVQIRPGETRKLEYINKALKSAGKEPLPYQIMVIFYDYKKMNSLGDFAGMVAGEVLGGGCIPVFLINDNEMPSAKDRYATDWDKLLEQAEKHSVQF